MAQDEFLKIGYETTVEKFRWSGPVVATREAIYCALTVANNPGFSAVGGLVGGLVGAALAASAKSSLPFRTTIGEAPAALRAPGTGPFRRMKDHVTMLVIPRGSVREIVKGSWINNTLRLTLEGDKVVIAHRLFGAAAVRDFLVATGWPLTWRGRRFHAGAVGRN
jgi:hypothetical protein